MGQDREHARQAGRVRRVEAGDARMRDRRAQHVPERLAAGAQIVDEAAGTAEKALVLHAPAGPAALGGCGSGRGRFGHGPLIGEAPREHEPWRS